MSAHVVPLLHTHLGICNKILEVIDNAAAAANQAWARARAEAGVSNVEGDDEDKHARRHLAQVLSKYGVRREKYFTGKLSGGPGTRLMRPLTMQRVTSEFFAELVQAGMTDGQECVRSCLVHRVGVAETEIADVCETLVELAALYGADDECVSGGTLRPLMMTKR